MSGWAAGRLCAFDSETDGPDPEDARIITATVPERPIPAEASAIHGVSTEHATEHGVARAAGIRQIAEMVEGAFANGVPVVAFNAAFDFTVLDRECRRVGVEGPDPSLGVVIDPHVIDKAVDRFRRGKRTLGATCQHYGIDLGEAHDATADALGAARLAYKLAARYPAEVGERTPAEMHALQVDWRAQQSASLQEYFERQGKREVVDGSWPYRPLAAGVAS